MGFWGAFLGNTVANAIKDARHEEEQHKKRNQLFDELLQNDIDFNSFLESAGINGIYSFDINILDGGQAAVTEEKRKLETYKRKINEFITLGGDAFYVEDYRLIDDYIEKLKYLKSMNRLDEQWTYLDKDINDIQNRIEADIEIENELKDIGQEIEALQAEITKMTKIANIINSGYDINSMSGIEFEELCQTLVELMGFSTESTKASGDGGIDIIAYNYQPIISGKYIIQCKRYSGSVGEPVIRDLYGVVMSERANKGILMTTGYFTNHALNFAVDKPIELIDGQKLNDLLEQYQILK